MKKILQSIVNLSRQEILVERIYVLSEVEIRYQKNFVKTVNRCLQKKLELPTPKGFGCKPGICCQANVHLTCMDCQKISLDPNDVIYPQNLITGYDGVLTIIKNELVPVSLSWLVANVEGNIFSLYNPLVKTG
jgi:hypothetical protein